MSMNEDDISAFVASLDHLTKCSSQMDFVGVMVPDGMEAEEMIGALSHCSSMDQILDLASVDRDIVIKDGKPEETSKAIMAIFRATCVRDYGHSDYHVVQTRTGDRFAYPQQEG